MNTSKSPNATERVDTAVSFLLILKTIYQNILMISMNFALVFKLVQFFSLLSPEYQAEMIHLDPCPSRWQFCGSHCSEYGYETLFGEYLGSGRLGCYSSFEERIPFANDCSGLCTTLYCRSDKFWTESAYLTFSSGGYGCAIQFDPIVNTMNILAMLNVLFEGIYAMFSLMPIVFVPQLVSMIYEKDLKKINVNWCSDNNMEYHYMIFERSLLFPVFLLFRPYYFGKFLLEGYRYDYSDNYWHSVIYTVFLGLLGGLNGLLIAIIRSDTGNCIMGMFQLVNALYGLMVICGKQFVQDLANDKQDTKFSRV